jgi:hypothetical protein
MRPASLQEMIFIESPSRQQSDGVQPVGFQCRHFMVAERRHTAVLLCHGMRRSAGRRMSRLLALQFFPVWPMPLTGPRRRTFFLHVSRRDFVLFHRYGKDRQGHLADLNDGPWPAVGRSHRPDPAHDRVAAPFMEREVGRDVWGIIHQGSGHHHKRRRCGEDNWGRTNADVDRHIRPRGRDAGPRQSGSSRAYHPRVQISVA